MERAILKKNAKNQLKGNWCIAVITFLVGGIILGVIPSITTFVESKGIECILGIVVILISGSIVYGMYRFALSFTEGKKPQFSELFSGFDGKVFLKCLGLYIIMTIAITIGFIILIVPGIIISLMYSQAYFILCEDNSKSVMQCLKESAEMMKGHKWEYFVLILSFLGWAVLCCVTCGIASLWVVPYEYVTFANYYNDLKSKL